MSGRINRDDPDYAAAMREAKAQFEAAMAKSAMKGRGRSAAKQSAAPAPSAEEAAAADAAEFQSDLATVLDAERRAKETSTERESPPAATKRPSGKRQQQRDPGRS